MTARTTADRTSRLCALSIAAACSLTTTRVEAQGRGQTTPLGGRSVLLGGTGVAAGTDAAVPLLNPAGILGVDAGLLSFSTRFVRIGAREFEGFRKVGVPSISAAKVADPNVTDVSFSALPSGTCYFARVLSGPDGGPQRPHKFSFCIYQSEYEQTSAQGGLVTANSGAGRVDLATSVTSEWQRNHFGLGWATPLGKRAALGISSFVVQTSMNRTDIAAGIVGGPNPVGGTHLLTVKGGTVQLVNRIGFTLKAGRYLTTGASLRAPGLTMLRAGELISSRTSPDGSVLFEAGDASFSAPLPAQVALGMAFATPRLHLELNGFYDFPGPMATFEPDQDTVIVSSGSPTPAMARARKERARGRANVGFGAEYQFSDSYSGLAGVATNFSTLTPRDPRLNDQLFAARRDGVTTSLGLGAQGPLGKIITGVRLEYLYGELLVPTTTGKSLLVDDREWAVTLTFSGQVRVADALRSARDLILGQPPKPD